MHVHEGPGPATPMHMDCVIAQACLRNDYALLTKDDDFRRIAARTSLKLVEFS